MRIALSLLSLCPGQDGGAETYVRALVRHLPKASTGDALLLLLAEVAPDEVYNLAGHSFVPQSWEDPATAIRITSRPVIHLLAKVFAHQLVALYRAHYGLFACAGILFNRESPRRPAQFVTAKVCHAAKAIRAGRQHELWLGDLEVTRDWGFAGAPASPRGSSPIRRRRGASSPGGRRPDSRTWSR